MELPAIVGVMEVAVVLLLVAAAGASLLPGSVLAVLVVVGVAFLVLVAIYILSH